MSEADIIRMFQSSPLLSVAQVAERLGMTEEAVYELIGAGELPFLRAGSKTLIPEGGLAMIGKRGGQ
jgi:excisionase family DNA binding protein